MKDRNYKRNKPLERKLFAKPNLTLSSSIVIYLQEKENMTLKEIGGLMKLSESFISYVKKGERSFTIARLQLLEKALKRPLPWLFLDAVDKNSIPADLKAQYKLLRRAFTSLETLQNRLTFGKNAEEP